MLGLPTQPLVSDEGIHKIAEAFVTVVVEKYEETIRKNASDVQARADAYEDARVLGYYVAMKRFSTEHIIKESKLFTTIYNRTIEKLQTINK